LPGFLSVKPLFGAFSILEYNKLVCQKPV